MMRKIDKLIVKQFLLSLILNFSLVVFILLMFALMQKFKYFVGKGLGLDVYVEFYFFYSLVSTPIALHVAVLVSSLMTFGNLGEHSELIAIKGSGVSTLRIMRYPFLIAILLTLFGIYFNDRIHPYASLQAYSLLYDVRQKKPTLDFEAGIFYNGIPNYSIKIGKKYANGRSIRDIMIYDHSRRKGNTQVIVADSAYMYITPDEQYMYLNLFRGNLYIDVGKENRNKKFGFSKSNFQQAQLFFTLASFELKDTDDKLFLGHNIMKTQGELSKEMDSVAQKLINEKNILKKTLFAPRQKALSQKDSTEPARIKAQNQDLLLDDSLLLYKKDTIGVRSVYGIKNDNYTLNIASEIAKKHLTKIRNSQNRFVQLRKEITFDQIDIYRKYADAIIVFIMFLIGAPLGAIIKRGGLGVPALVAITCFTFYYAMVTAGIKLAQESILLPEVGCWIAHLACAVLAAILLNEAKKDSYLFDLDHYMILMSKILRKLRLQ